MIRTSNIFLCEQIPINYDKTTAGYPLDLMFTLYLVFDAIKWLSALSQIRVYPEGIQVCFHLSETDRDWWSLMGAANYR